MIVGNNKGTLIEQSHLYSIGSMNQYDIGEMTIPQTLVQLLFCSYKIFISNVSSLTGLIHKWFAYVVLNA